MRFSVAVTFLAVAASASADTFFRRQDTSYPACAVPCTTNADLGGCQVTDYHCLCTSQSFVASVTKCLTSSCKGDDLQKALSLSQQLCAKVGVTLTASSPSSASHTSTSTSPSATSKSGASSTNRNALFGLAIAALAAFSFA